MTYITSSAFVVNVGTKGQKVNIHDLMVIRLENRPIKWYHATETCVAAEAGIFNYNHFNDVRKSDLWQPAHEEFVKDNNLDEKDANYIRGKRTSGDDAMQAKAKASKMKLLARDAGILGNKVFDKLGQFHGMTLEKLLQDELVYLRDADKEFVQMDDILGATIVDPRKFMFPDYTDNDLMDEMVDACVETLLTHSMVSYVFHRKQAIQKAKAEAEAEAKRKRDAAVETLASLGIMDPTDEQIKTLVEKLA